jgi:ACS family tartrate transporter-like MFS transporter
MDQDQARRSATAKAARRLLPFLCLCYAVNFLDRVNVGFAALAMNQDLGLTPSIFGAGAGIFFIGYLLFEIPSNLALQRFGARIWIARIMISWGLVASAMALVSGTTGFYLMRFLLGVAEAGFFPGIILYLTYWFPARERARIVSLFMAAVPLATVVGGPVSGALLELHGVGGLKGWHWLFIVEGLPAVLLGFVALKFLDDRPQEAAWLSQDERTALASTLASEAEATRETGYADLGHALTKPRVLTLALLYFCIMVGLYGIGFWMPQVIQTFGLSSVSIGFLTAIPFWSLPTAILTGTGAAAGLALVNATGNLGGLAGPTVMGVMKEATGTFTSGLLFLAGALVLGALIVLLFGYATRPRGIGSPRASAQDLP